jgi:hypothetical protein
VSSLGQISGAASPSKRQREWYYRNIFHMSRRQEGKKARGQEDKSNANAVPLSPQGW